MKPGTAIKKQQLSEEQIQEICTLYSTGDWSLKRLAKKYGVSKYQIKKAVKGIVKPKPTALQRFNEKWTEDENGCHVWKGYKSKVGYGQFKMNKKVYRSHRASFELKKRPLEPGEVVRHKCDNPSCVNVNHLELGTVQDNNMDKLERFRQPWHYAVIDYLEMLFMYQIGVPIDIIARRFSIKKTTLKSRLKDMEKSAVDPTEDRVFHYRDRAIHEDRVKS
ncbi:HNH endonuclease [Bacillus salipaludis]|uniref:HNH endonuclease n=1 Tax=Bacillus salipaludis TaxID=2547811 RepID=A0AA90R5N6_9BACI|nr:HNH endonuclease [Bacillus salipaludis]MDQ6598076.1 HNH endonuclease [Bacillus salipaludis]